MIFEVNCLQKKRFRREWKWLADWLASMARAKRQTNEKPNYISIITARLLGIAEFGLQIDECKPHNLALPLAQVLKLQEKQSIRPSSRDIAIPTYRRINYAECRDGWGRAVCEQQPLGRVVVLPAINGTSKSESCQAIARPLSGTA